MPEEISLKARENRASRAAKRQGFFLAKSRRRDPKARDYGLYVLADDRDDAPALFADGDGVSLDTIEAVLNWQDIFLVEPGTDPVSVDYPDNRAVVDFSPVMGIGWRAILLNDGNPIDYALAGDREDSEFAVEQAQSWVRDLIRQQHRTVVQYVEGRAFARMSSNNAEPGSYYEIRDTDGVTRLASLVPGEALNKARAQQRRADLADGSSNTSTSLVDVTDLIARFSRT